MNYGGSVPEPLLPPHIALFNPKLAGGKLYAANFSEGQIDVFNSDFSAATPLKDANIPAGFAPFNVQSVGSLLVVTFAKPRSSTNAS